MAEVKGLAAVLAEFAAEEAENEREIARLFEKLGGDPARLFEYKAALIAEQDLGSADPGRKILPRDFGFKPSSERGFKHS